MRPYERDPAEIYRQSFATVRAEANLDRFDTGMQSLDVRLIHACGMVEVADRIAYSQGAYLAGHRALKRAHQCCVIAKWLVPVSFGAICRAIIK